MRDRLAALCVAFVCIASASSVAAAAATPAQIAERAVVKMRAASAAALKSLSRQEKAALKPLRAFAEEGTSVQHRRLVVLRRSARLGPTAEDACQKIIRLRDKALGRLVALEDTASAADIAAARGLLRSERDALHGAIDARAEQVAENLALAATLDPGDRDEVDTLTPNVASPSCEVEAREE